jgi:hypothetical protein
MQSILLQKIQELKLQAESGSPVRSREVSRICKEVSTIYTEHSGDNLFRIMDYLILQKGLTVDDLIKLLKTNAEFDEVTIAREADSNFDKEHGTLTSPIINQFELPEHVTSDRILHSARYHPSPIASVNQILSSLEKYDVRYERYIFIDVGPGLGRNLLLASKFRFRRIIGIEHSKHLHSIAKENVKRYFGETACRNPIDLHCTDSLN